MEGHLDALATNPARDDRDQRIAELVSCARPLTPLLSRLMGGAGPALRRVLLEVMTRRYYRMHPLQDFEDLEVDRFGMLTARYTFEDRRFNLATWFIGLDDLADAARAFALHASRLPEGELAVADFYAVYEGDPPPREQISHALLDVLARVELPKSVHRIVVAVAKPGQARGISAVDFFTFHPGDYGLVEDEVLKGLHPMMGERLELWRLEHFALQPLHSPEDVYLFRGVAKGNSKDERLFALAEVRDLTSIRDIDGKIESLPELERAMVDALEGIREFQAHREPSRRLHWNRVLLYVWPTIELHRAELGRLVHRMSAATLGLGIETVLVCGRMREGDDSEERDVVLRFITAAGGEPVMEVDDPPRQPLRPLDESARRISSARRRGTAHPAEIVNLIAPGGGFVEHDFDEHGKLVPVDRPPATNDAGIVVGLMRNFNERYPEGMLRVALLGDPTHALGSLAEPECMRIMAALDMAEELGVPLEWFALSAGAKIAMDSGTENMDWIAAVLRRIIEFTQRGGELNVVVTGINVGAQPYWNAEATMLMHTSGILVMTPDSAMVLTGKQALDYSGGVSADDNFGIGGYERVMGPNGQAQYWAPNLPAACRLLLNHYEHAYVAPGERFPRRAETSDPIERDVSGEPHFAPGSDLHTVGDIFSDDTNPGRKAAFDIRSVMRGAVDHDHPPLERWAAMRDAENAVVWEAHLGGWPVTMLGIESRPLSRHGMVPADGPQQWTSGTLFPRSSKKIARAINAASGRRPVVVLANLAGFDGSPDSMRGCQLEFGAEIGRAVVNFDGPIVFCVVSRYHGGAFVVFSQKLNENLETVALEGAKASVIGGAPAAAVVFAREVDSAARADERIASLDERIATAEGAERQRLRLERAELWTDVHNEKMGELAAEFDNTHSVERAVQMGSVSRIISPTTLRPYLVDAVERGMRRTLEGAGSDGAQLADALVR